MPNSPIASAAPDIDFSVCENEKIRQPGSIQAHGFLWAMPLAEDRIVALSDNFSAFLDQPAAEFLEKSPLHLLGALGWSESPFPGEIPLGPEHWSGTAELRGEVVHLYAHQQGAYRLFEIETRPSSALVKVQEDAVAELAALSFPDDSNLYEASRRVASAVATASGYNRVMVYRFAPDWSGEVIAEWREPILVPYLGLHYPATDIPSQARALYRENHLRAIANVTSIAAAVLIADAAVQLDLSHAMLRAVSPYHLEYLQNMGVGSTLTASLLVQGELWGLIACHHTAPYLPSPAIREAIAEAARRFSLWLEKREESEKARVEKEQRTDATLLREILGPTLPSHLWRKLFFGRERLTALFQADSAALVIGDQVATIGGCPSPAWIRLLAKSLLRESEPRASLFWEEIPALPEVAPNDPWPPRVCGVAGSIVLRQPEPVLVFVFRNELIQEVHWGGDPTRPVEIDERQRLSPRKSFDLWRQTIQGKSKPWTEQSHLRMQELARILADLCTRPNYLDGLKESFGTLVEQDIYLSSEGIQLADSFLQGMALLTGGKPGEPSHILSANAKFCDTFSIDTLRIRGNTVEEMMQSLSATVIEDLGDRQILEIWSPQQGHRILSLQRKSFLNYDGPYKSVHLELFDFQDVTNDRRLREAMRVARDQALHASELKSAVLANMSHELRTPLSAILSYSEMLAEELFGPIEIPQYKRAAQDIHSAGSHLMELVNDLLDLAKLESGTTAIQRQKINLVELVKQCADWVRPLTQKSSIELETITRSGTIFYFADPVRMKQVLTNLLTNAVKFTPPGGRITILVEEHVNKGVILEVQDSGAGIPADKVRHIFDRFYQADTSDLRRVQGAGLGLSIVRAIVELHGGRIQVESRHGQGTRMRVSLPDLSMARLDSRGGLIQK